MTTSRDEAPAHTRLKAKSAVATVAGKRLLPQQPNYGLGKDCYPNLDARMVPVDVAVSNMIAYGSSQDETELASLYRQVATLCRDRKARVRKYRRQLVARVRELHAKAQKQSLNSQRVRYDHIEGYILLRGEVNIPVNGLFPSRLSVYRDYIAPARKWLRSYAQPALACGNFDLTVYTRDLAPYLVTEIARPITVGDDRWRRYIAPFMGRLVAISEQSLLQLRRKLTRKDESGKVVEPTLKWIDHAEFGVLFRRTKRVRRLTEKEKKKYLARTRRFSKLVALARASQELRGQAEHDYAQLSDKIDALYEEIHKRVTFHQMVHETAYPLKPTGQCQSSVERQLAYASPHTIGDWPLSRGWCLLASGMADQYMSAVSRDGDSDRVTITVSTVDQDGVEQKPNWPFTCDLPSDTEKSYIDGTSSTSTRATPYGQWDETPNDYESNLDAAIQRSVGKLRNLRIGSNADSFNLGRSTAELKDTPLLVKQVEELLGFSKLSIMRVASRIRRKPILAAKYESVLREVRAKSISEMPLRLVASLYLAYKFGVEPSLNDINTLCRSTRTWVRAVRRGLVEMYRVSRGIYKDATMRSYVADANVLQPELYSMEPLTGMPRLDITETFPVLADTPTLSSDGLWNPFLDHSGIECPEWFEYRANGVDWELTPNLLYALRSDDRRWDEEYIEDEVVPALTRRVVNTITSYSMLRFRWFLRRNSKVFARISGEEIKRILAIEDQRNLLGGILSWKTAWELTPLSFIIDWFTNSMKIVSTVTDTFQAWSENVTFTDQGLWAVIRSVALGQWVIPTEAKVHGIQIYPDNVSSGEAYCRYMAPDGVLRYYPRSLTQLSVDQGTLEHVANGDLDGCIHPIEVSPDQASFDWSRVVEKDSQLYYATYGRIKCDISLSYNGAGNGTAHRICDVTTRLPIESDVWAALRPRLEFHLTGSKFLSLLAILTQSARWARKVFQ